MELRFFKLLAVVLTAATSAGIVYGDTWMAPTETRTAWSLDRTAKAVVTTKTGMNWERTQSHIAVWRTEPNKPDELAWESDLVNIPHEIFVASEAKSVVTMDRWGRIGQDAIVFYGPEGKVKRHYRNAKELLTTKEISRIKQTVSSFWWKQDGCAEFTADGDHFLVWLAWGKALVFQSDTGEKIEAKPFQRNSQNRKVVFDAVDILKKSENPNDRIKAVRFVGWLGGKASLSVLREFMKDPYYKDGFWRKMDDPWQRFGENYFRVFTRTYPVRRAAAEELHIGCGQVRGSGVVQEGIAR